MNPDLIKVTEIFLVPSSFLVAALGTADTNPHRAAVALLGLLVSVLWQVCSHEALTELRRANPEEVDPLPRRTAILNWLPAVFIAGWLGALLVHLVIWNRPIL